MMLSLLEDLCRRDVRPKMWRPPAFECAAPSETLTKARSGVVADSPPEVWMFYQVKGLLFNLAISFDHEF